MHGLDYPDLLKGLELLFVYERDWVPHNHYRRGCRRDEALRVVCSRLLQWFCLQECQDSYEDGYERAKAEIDD